MDVTLRSRKELGETKKNLNKEEQSEKEKGEAEIEGKMEAETEKEGVEVNNRGEKQKSDEVVLERIYFPKNPPLYTSPLPFPQKFRKTKLDEQFAKFLNMFKKLEINIPFADALDKMPNYVKFMKEIMSNKKKLEAYGIVNLSENCSTII